MEFLIILVWTAFLFFFMPWCFHKSVLEFSPSRGKWWSLWLYKQFVFVLPVPMLLSVFSVKDFSSALLVVRDTQTFEINILVLYAITIYFLTAGVCIRMVPERWLPLQNTSTIANRKIYIFSYIAVAMGFAVMVVGILFFNLHHALIDVLLSGQKLVAVRLANAYKSGVPTQLQFIMTVSSWIAAIYSGYRYAGGSKQIALFFLISGLILASVGGGKGPIVSVLLIAVISALVFLRRRLSLKFIITIPIGFFLILFFLYFIVSLQIPGLSPQSFIMYLVNRLGVGQMSGTYDGIALGDLHGEFYWDMIPFANFFVQDIPYHKLLMMVVEGYGFSEMGVKNSFFISEAFGIGGYWLVIASPFIVGATYVLSIIVLYHVLRKMFGRDVASMYFLPLALLHLDVTGGFSSFPFLKGTLLVIAVLGTYWIPFSIYTMFTRRASLSSYGANRSNILVQHTNVGSLGKEI